MPMLEKIKQELSKELRAGIFALAPIKQQFCFTVDDRKKKRRNKFWWKCIKVSRPSSVNDTHK